MSVSGISASSYLSQTLQNWQTKAQTIQSEFQQLGQDLQSGNLTQAQSDFTTLSQNLPSSLQNNSTLSQAFSSLGTALQSGNVSAAQKAYSTLQTDLEQAGQGRHHHHHGGQSSSTSSSQGSTLSQLFSTLGSALTAGNLSAAQTAYTTLTQDLPQFGSSFGGSTPSVAGVLSYLG